MEMGKPGLLFDGFIGCLRRQGFVIGVDHHLRLQELLNKLGPGCKPADLKYLLCPIFAANEKQQQQFYRTFDLYFKPLETAAAPAIEYPAEKPEKKEIVESPETEVTPPKWQYILLGILLIVLAVVLIYQCGGKGAIKNELQEFASNAQPGSGTKPGGGTDAAGDKGTGTVKTPGDTQPKPNENPVEKVTTEKPGGAGKSNKSSESITIKDIFRQYRYIVQWIELLTPFIILLLIELYKYNRRRLILVKQRGKKPPFVWPIKVETPGTGFMKNDRFYKAAHFLRKRMESDITCLDVEKTISKTIENVGFPALHYKPLTRPPEYLILIDLPGYRDHYSHLWDNMAAALGSEGVYVTRYFYEQDPRVCFKEFDGQREYLFDLKTRYSDHRLIICGDGDELLDPLTGEMARWTGLFQAWRERALLTTRPPREWGGQEITLAGDFILAPASLEGLCTLKDHWELPKEPGVKNWKDDDTVSPLLMPGREEDHAEELRDYLGSETFQWLCACAVYPELHWDLTLYLGTLSCMPENLVSEENMLRLLRLLWFQTGSMPDELRWALISRLDTGKSKAIRSAIVDLLEKNPPPTGSFADESYRLHLVVQHWMLFREDRQKRKAMLRSLKSTGEKSIVQDYTLLRFLEAAPGTPLHFVLPKRMRKLFYNKDIPLFGFRTGIRVTITILIAIISFLFLKAPNVDNTVTGVHKLLITPVKKVSPPYVGTKGQKLLDVPQSEKLPLEEQQAVEKAVGKVNKNKEGFWEADYGDEIIMIYIPPGEFTMGSDDYDDEKPMHKVYLDGYWIGKYEIIFAQYDKYCNKNGKKKPDDKGWGRENRPVINISWDEATAYCEWLSGKTGLKFKLPTEAQWEKAARGTDSRKYPWGNREPDNKLGNFDFVIGRTVPVGLYPEGISPYGLFDMAGNVWEWCIDWHDSSYYKNSPLKNTQGPNIGSYRVVRGGSLADGVRNLRCADRGYVAPTHRYSDVGFRLCQENKFIYTFEKVINDREKSRLNILEINPGFEYIEETVLPNSESFTVKMVRINQALYEFRVLGRDSISNNALSLDDHQKQTNAICVLNGGFRETFNAHETIGLLIIDGKIVNPLTTRYSGIFAVNNTGAFILYTKDFTTPRDYKYALQAYPVIVDKGGRVSVGIQPDKVFHRTFVAVDRENRIILGISTPVSLYQLATYLSQNNGLNCTIALNLEGGGGVSGMVIKLKDFSKKIDVYDYPVPNAIAVFSK